MPRGKVETVSGLEAASPPESAALMRALAAHPEQMATLIEALHRRAVDADSLLDLMGRIARQAVRLLPGVRWAGVTAQFDAGAPLTAGHTDQRVLMVDEGQYTAGDGPCLQAMRSGRPVAMTLLQVAARWPHLVRSAQDVGVRSFLAVPLNVNGRPVGVLNLYSDHDAVPEPDPDYLTVLTEYAARGLTDYQAHQPAAVTGAALRAALAECTVVEQAITVLMLRYGFTADYAMDVLSDQARDWNRTRPEQAAHIIDEITR